MNKEEFLKLLDKYLVGDASSEDEQFLFEVYYHMEEKYKWSPVELQSLDMLENKLIQQFKDSIRQPQITGSKNEIVFRDYFDKKLLLRVAAIITAFLCIGIYFIKRDSYKTSKIFVNNEVKNPVIHINNTHMTEKVVLPDNSFVNLKAGSKIVYEKDFTGRLRQVYLEGEGFFQVTKDHSKPFIVYTDKVVAKVLGTSFIIKSGLNNTETSVLVKTGKVSVFKTVEFTREDEKADLVEGVVILPNQTAQLNSKAFLEKKLAGSPEILKPQFSKSFDFDNTPIDTVFSRLQNMYGIPILYDKIKMNSCTLSVDMGKEDFYQKLNLICRTINASYEVRDGNVLVSGPGCAN